MTDKMTSRERVLEGLKHKETDRIPFSLGFGVNYPAVKKLQEFLGMKTIRQVEDYLYGFCDIRNIDPEYSGPSDRNKSFDDGGYIDIWGVARKPVSYGEGTYDEICFHPLSNVDDISDLDLFQWPSSNWWNTGSLKEIISRINNSNEHAIRIGSGNIYETSWYMRGFEQMFIDLIENPELAWEIMTRVTDYFIAYSEKVLQETEGMVDIAFTADDIGGQQGLLLSLDLWEKMVKPHHIRLNKALHEYGVKILYHTDGSVMKAIPGLIDMGIDILDPLQFDAKGMDPVQLKDCYGDQLCFHGGVSVQKTLPFGTVEEVIKETKVRIDVLGKNGGYLLAPSHAIQAGTPPENIVAFLETAKNYNYR